MQVLTAQVRKLRVRIFIADNLRCIRVSELGICVVGGGKRT